MLLSPPAATVRLMTDLSATFSITDPTTGIFVKGDRDESLAFAASLAKEFPVVLCDLATMTEESVREVSMRTRALGLCLVVVGEGLLPFSIAQNIGNCVDLSLAS